MSRIFTSNVAPQVVQFRAAGELVFHVFGAIAQFERRLNLKRTKDWLATTRKHGRNLGHPPLPQK